MSHRWTINFDRFIDFIFWVRFCSRKHVSLCDEVYLMFFYFQLLCTMEIVEMKYDADIGSHDGTQVKKQKIMIAS